MKKDEKKCSKCGTTEKSHNLDYRGRCYCCKSRDDDDDRRTAERNNPFSPMNLAIGTALGMPGCITGF